MERAGIVAVLLGALAAAPCPGETLRLECTADTSICIHPSEQNHNHGGRSRLRVKGNEHILLMAFDTSPLAGRAVRSAQLFFRPAGAVQLKTLGLSMVMEDWREGTSSGPAKTGEVTFLMAAHDERTWDGPGSTFLSVTFGRGKSGMVWAGPADRRIDSPETPAKARAWYRDVRSEADGWLSIDVPPELVAALAQGTSHGLALSDETGQTRANNDIFSREQMGRGPYLVVERDTKPMRPARRQARRAAAKRAGPAADLVGRPRRAPQAGAWAEAGGLRYRVEPLWGQADPATGKDHFPGGRSGWVWDGKAVQLHAARAWHACVQVVVEPVGGQVWPVIEPGALRSAKGAQLGARRRVDAVWYIKGPREGGARQWLPDPLIGAGDARAGIGIGQPRCRAWLVEYYVPRDAAQGLYEGSILIRRPGGEAVAIPVRLTVHRAVLPDELGFKVSLNTYGSPGGKHGRRYPSKEFLAEERAWHRMAHEHRATIAAVPYSQSGQVRVGEAPQIEASPSGEVKVAWAEWDRHWAPYFTGEAFKGLPRDGVPLDHVYLPMHENWPFEIEAHYTWAGDWATHWKRAGPIEEGLPDRYQKAFETVSAAFAEHVVARKWTRTQFQCYLNNKYSFKQRGRGSSYWLLDEPMHRDDFRALRFFGRLFRVGVSHVGRPGNVVFRVDLSRPQWDRGYLGEVTGLCVCNAWRDCPGETFDEGRGTVWSYGTTPGPDAPLTDVWRWLLEAWAAGCDGMVPWQTIGRQDSWTVTEATSVIYPSRPGMPEGPVASLRLKVLRAAEQDIELWRLVAQKEGWPSGDRDTRRARLAAKTGRKVLTVRGLPRAPEVTVDLSGVRADEIINLRGRLLEALDK